MGKRVREVENWDSLQLVIKDEIGREKEKM